MSKFDYLIIGAGLAGLTLANELTKNRKKVLLLEKEPVVGGLAKSFNYNYKGRDFIFDIGPKRFHTDDEQIKKYIYSVLKNDYTLTGRASSVYLFDKYFSWPITTKDIFKLPPTIQIKIAYDLVQKITTKKSKPESDGFNDYIIDKYGKTLFENFFREYTQKFLQRKTEDIHKDWATTGINRSIIDKEAKGNSIFELVKTVLLPQPINTTFIYPSKQGFGYFCQKIEKEIISNHGTIVTDINITSLDLKNNTIFFNQKNRIQKHSFGKIIWTGNINDLCHHLGIKSQLEYISTLLFNFAVRQEEKRKDQWIYYGSAKLKMARATITKNFASYICPPQYTTYTVEKTCKYNDSFWNKPNSLKNTITDELIKTKLVANPDMIKLLKIEKIKDTYPLYDLEYKKKYQKTHASILEKSKDIFLLGRLGTFWYNNADHSIKAALQMTDFLLGRRKTIPSKETIFS